MMISKTYMMYHKFLSDNAHLKVDLIDEDMKSKLKEIIELEMNKLSCDEQEKLEQGTTNIAVVTGEKIVRK